MFCLTFLILLCRTDVDRLIDQILLEEQMISESRKPQLKKLIESKYIFIGFADFFNV